MNRYGFKFHHLGLAVNNPLRSLIYIKGLGYKVGNEIYDPLQNVNLIMCTHKTMPDIEIIFQSGTEGPLNNILKTRQDSIYHICYECSSKINWLERMKEDKIRVISISESKPACLFDGKLVGFYYIAGFGLTEILYVD